MDKRLFFLLNKARHNLYNHLERVMNNAVGVPMAQMSALLALSVRDGCQLKDLSTFLSLNKSGTTGLTDRMEKNQLITKVPDKQDGRVSRIFISQKGKEVLKKAKPIIKAQNTKLQQGFDDHEMEIIVRFLNHASDSNNL